MSLLTLLLGPAGSGKTHRVLTEAAKHALAYGLASAEHPPLLIIVPEQQGVSTERAVLSRLAELSGGRVRAASRIRVMSFNRLAHVLAERAGAPFAPLGELGRRLLIWRLLDRIGDPAERQARATALSDVIAELALYGTSADDLSQRAAELQDNPDSQAAALALKLAEVSQLLNAYQAECSARGLEYRPAALRIPELLAEHNWPLLKHTLVWIDGFAGFTPAEEGALSALLRNCAAVTAALLIDSGRLAGAGDEDWADWYQPTRQTYLRFKALAADCAAPIEEIRLGEAADDDVAVLPRWPADSALARIARSGLQANGDAGPRDSGGELRAVVCADERMEVDNAARHILDLNAHGLRFADISVVCRSLAPYADLISARFREHGIPAFIDERRSLAQHPAAELLRSGLRLVLNQASADDAVALLRSGLLLGDPAADVPAGQRDDRADQLVNYAREHGLYAASWLMPAPWRWRRHSRWSDEAPDGIRDAAQAQLEQLDAWRRELLAPLTAARERLAAIADRPPLVHEVLGALWECLVTPAVAGELERWAHGCEGEDLQRPEGSALHRGVLTRLSALWDELALLAGDLPVAATGGITAAELCAWVESGIAALTMGQTPPRLDSVLVTEIERGRHHPVRATLLIGLADDAWPPPAGEGAYLSDGERALLNGADDSLRLMGGGAAERAAREPYLALVAATRSAEHIYISRPGATAEGGLRPPSPYYTGILGALGGTEEFAGADGRFGDPRLAGTLGDLAVWAALKLDNAAADALLAHGGAGAQSARAALAWSDGRVRPERRHAVLAPELLAGALGKPAADGTWCLRASPSRLETFAACPFKHYARYYLRLNETLEPSFDNRVLGGFYHAVLQQAIEALAAGGYSDLAAIRRALEEAVEACAAELAEGQNRERAPYIIERARVLLWQLARQLLAQFAQGRKPAATELSIGGQAPALKYSLAGDGLSLTLTGFIDRLDLAAGGAATVIDYKMSGAKTDWARFLAGEQLQLFAYMLAVAESGTELTGGGVTPAGLEYQPVEPVWRRGQADFSPQCVPPSLYHEKQREKLTELLPNTLKQARRIILELAGRIVAGEVAPLPLLVARDRERTACAHCGYRGVCRFDPLAGEQYRRAPVTAESELRDALAQGADFSGSALADGREVRHEH